MISDMMAIKAVFALFCDQLSLVLLGHKAMTKGEEACSRFSSVHLVALALESIYIEVHILESVIVFINQSTFARLRLYDDSRFNVAAFYFGFRIVIRIAFNYTSYFDQLMKSFLTRIQEALNFEMCILYL